MKVVVCDLQVKLSLFSSEQEIAFLQGVRVLVRLILERELSQAGVVSESPEALISFFLSVAQMECEK
jgi:hypothetical protein